MKSKVIYIGKLILLFFTILVVSIAALLFGGHFFFSRAPLWRTIQSIPDGTIVSILDVGMIPMGHIDNVYVLTDKGTVYVWERESSLFNSGQGAWRAIANVPDNGAIADLKKFSAWPHYGVYIETDTGNYYAYTGYDSGAEVWEPIPQEDYLRLPDKDSQDSFDLKHSFWPEVAEPYGKVIDRDSFYISGSMSEEARNYVLMKNGSFKVLSRTFSPFSIIEYIVIGFIVGIIINTIVFSILFIRKKRIF